MKIGYVIGELRRKANLTQAQFSEIFGVSQQSVQKWESGSSTPDLEKIVAISKYFDVSLDALILGNSNRIVEEMGRNRAIKPQYQNIHDWEFYSSNLEIEYEQSIEEGLDVERYRDVFLAVSMLPKSEFKKKLGGDIVVNKKTFMLINAYQKANPEQKAELDKWILAETFDSDKKIAAITHIYNILGIDKLAQQKIEQLFAIALQSLDKVKVADEKKAELRLFANTLLGRRY